MAKLGDKVRDNITGFTGIAVGESKWLFGCSRFLVEPDELKDGKPIEACWFDEQRIETVHAAAPKVSVESRSAIGGPQRDPSPSPSPGM